MIGGTQDQTVFAQQTDTSQTEVQADSSLSGIKMYNAGDRSRVSRLTGVQRGLLYGITLPSEETRVLWDSVDTYTISRRLNGYNLKVPSVVSFDEFTELKKQQQKNSIRKTLIEESQSQEEDQRGLLDFSINVPGGENSAFTTIFGTNEVNLRVNGSANMNVGASIQKLEGGSIITDAQTTVDPTFNQNLQLNIQGTIGDKLTISTDWDTERQFDFENRLSIVYEGYEDEIIKSIEMGNVSMQTGNSLVSGGSALFGIKAVSELGPLKVTSVVSQQKGETNTQSISGGSQEQKFELRPADYEDGRHFFLDFFNRQQFEDNVDNPIEINNNYSIEEINVYISRTSGIPDDESVEAIALLDLGVVEQGQIAGQTQYGPPNNEMDRFDEEQLDSLRGGEATNTDFGVSSSEFVAASFELLQEGTDYERNNLGFISLNVFLNSGDAIAVSYKYRSGGQLYRVGEFDQIGSDRIYLKLLRPDGMTTEDRAWPLTMRNVYSLGVSDIQPEAFELEILDTRGTITENRLVPGRAQTILQDLGLDRLTIGGEVEPDNQPDIGSGFLEPGRISQSTGRILFPYLEPFGDRILEVLGNSVPDSVAAELAFTDLYDEKQVDAEKNSKNRNYLINGQSSGGVSSTFTLGFGLVEGSVTVTANGVELTEGTDYEVDYSFGSLTIINEKYLAAGQEIEVEYENNQFALIGQKNFTGIRAEYTITDDIKLGSTFFKLKEQPLSDKIRIGNEPINNTVLGFDANASFDAPWLTRLIDKVPLLQTREPSGFSFSGEFAQLRPGVAQTNAVQEAIDNGELYKDEENGLVFIDDFEGAEYTISFLNATRWNLAAAPAAVPGYMEDANYFTDSSFDPPGTLEDRKARTDLRGQFAWYTIPRNLSSIRSSSTPPEAEVVQVRDVFQGRETTNRQDDEISTLDINFDPTRRGVYNFNDNLRDLLELGPERTWGGMTAVIPSGQEDLAQNNIEFLEFWVQAVLPNGQEPDGLASEYDGKIYIDLGTISEDVVPNGKLNTEDGFNTILNSLVPDDEIDPRSYVSASGGTPTQDGQFPSENKDREDIGLDGAPNPGTPGAEARHEGIIFEEFINSICEDYGPDSEECQEVQEDPSNDDYVYYLEDQVQDLPLHQRFYRMLGYPDGNSPESGNSKKIAISLRPDTEALVNNSALKSSNNYYQYEIAFNPADTTNLQIGADSTFIIDRISKDPSYRSWYLVRIPLTEFTRSVGDIESFQNIRYMRLWMSGYKRPFTLRFATFEFVGSQWNKVSDLTETPATLDNFRVATINIEENASREPHAYRQPEGAIRALNRGAQVQALANEQSLVLGVEGLGPGEIHMVKKIYPGSLNLLNYSNMRMFVHGEGFDERGEAELVIRMGNDLENSYYEYRQPVTPSDPRDYSYTPSDEGKLLAEAENIWKYDENSMNILISAFNILKQRREQEDAPTDQVYEPAQQNFLEDAVEGAVISMKGNPSLDKISEIGMGIKNPCNLENMQCGGTTSLDVEFWLNELRVSGFDNETGWAANAKSTVKLADFATVNANITRQTDGFGGLQDRLADRSVSDVTGFGVTSTVNLHKLVPDRFGWNFPVTVSTRQRTSTPKYLPQQGDVRLTDFTDAVNSDPNLTDDEKQQIIDNQIYDSQTLSQNFSLNISDISKRNSRSKLAQYTIDNLKLSYVYNEGFSRSPNLRFEDSWDYKAGLNYTLALRRTKLVRPFKFTEEIPVAKVLSGLRFGYLPSSISTTSNISRSYSESRAKSISNPNAAQALSQRHSFTQQNTFQLNYTFTPSIPITFRTSTNFDLGRAGREELNQTGIDSSVYRVRPTFEVLDGLLTDTLSARRSRYTESYTASWRPNFTRIRSLNWLSYTATYGGGYQWNNSPEGSDQGANVANSFQLDHSLKIDTDKIFNSLGFYSKIEEADEAETKERKNKREARRKEIENEVPDSLRTIQQPDLLKDAKYAGRKLFLAVFSMKDFSISYSRSKSSSQDGYKGDSQFYYAFNTPGSEHYSPPLGYRIGLLENIPRDLIIENTGLNIDETKSYNDNITAGTRVTPLKNLSIDLDWTAGISSQEQETIVLSENGESTFTFSQTGTYNSSVWVFGSGYEDLFRRQVQTAYSDIVEGDEMIISDELGNSDGRTVLNRNSMEEDFRKAYLGANTAGLGDKGFLAFPKPSWRISWSQFQQFIPFLGKFMSNATLTHSYKGTYKVDWRYNPPDPGEAQTSSRVGAFDVFDDSKEYEPTSIRSERRFQPLAKLSVTWESRLKTDFGYNRNRISTLAISSRRVTETLSQGFDFGINYTFRNVSIPFLPKIKNNIDLSLRGNFADDSELNYDLAEDIGGALDASASSVSDPDQAQINFLEKTGQKRWNGTLTLGYRISSSISSNFEYTYSRLESNNLPTRTNHDIRFNVRIAISSR